MQSQRLPAAAPQSANMTPTAIAQVHRLVPRNSRHALLLHLCLSSLLLQLHLYLPAAPLQPLHRQLSSVRQLLGLLLPLLRR
jgi:hypothetical protein